MPVQATLAPVWCVGDVLHAQRLDRPLRAVHLSGNWGGTLPMPLLSGKRIDPGRWFRCATLRTSRARTCSTPRMAAAGCSSRPVPQEPAGAP